MFALFNARTLFSKTRLISPIQLVTVPNQALRNNIILLETQFFSENTVLNMLPVGL